MQGFQDFHDTTDQPLRLYRGEIALIDKEDMDKCRPYNWYLSTNGYVVARTKTGTLYLHRFVMGCEDQLEVDHRFHNRLDNRKRMLRVCEHFQNLANVRKDTFKGVVLDKRNGRWIAMTKFRQRGFHIGTFDTVEEAARAYDKIAKILFGEYARLNFPE